MKVSLQETVGRNYADFWNTQKRYRVCKGSRGSKKSKTTALNMIHRLFQYPESNGLCVRRYSNTLRDSVFSDLKWAIHRLGLDGYFDCTVSPMQIIRRSTGQKILFRGLDDGLKITSISVDYGVLCFVWIEEAYEITNEDDFNKLDMSIRGEVPDGYFKQITLTFNPWSATSWLKARFFDTPDEDVFVKTTTWQCNEWLDEADRNIFLKMKQNTIDPAESAGEGYGLAPIGHVVSVKSAKEVTVTLKTKITFDTGYSWSNLQNSIDTAVQDYLLELRKGWADTAYLVVRISQIETRLLSIKGIVDIENTKINGSTDNLTLGKYEVPVFGGASA